MQRHASHGAPRSYRAQTTPPKQRNVVLCIDNGASGLAIRKLMLEEAGYEVATCCNGNQGLELFFTRPVHIVLLDYALPGLNGMEIAKLMREAKPEVPIIMLSGYPDPPPGSLAVVDSYVVKGGRPAFLLSRVRQLLQQSSRQLTEERAKAAG